MHTAFRWIVCATLLCGLTRIAFALPDFLGGPQRTEVEKRILIIKDSNLGDLKQLSQSPRKWIITVIQVSPGRIKDDQAHLLMSWVHDGGSLWFHDSRLAALFGMKANPLLTLDMAVSKPHDGRYGDSKAKGVAAVARGAGSHVILSGVKEVAVFLLAVGDDGYSAVADGGDVVPLLKVNREGDQEAGHKVVAALRQVGKGSVIFKPLVWEENESTNRFQSNLRNWAAGSPIADLSKFDRLHEMEQSGRTKPSTALYDVVATTSGDILYGTVQNETLGTDLKTASVKRLDMPDVVVLKDGRTVKAAAKFGELLLKTAEGTVRRVRQEDIQRIELGVENR